MLLKKENTLKEIIDNSPFLINKQRLYYRPDEGFVSTNGEILLNDVDPGNRFMTVLVGTYDKNMNLISIQMERNGVALNRFHYFTLGAESIDEKDGIFTHRRPLTFYGRKNIGLDYSI